MKITSDKRNDSLLITDKDFHLRTNGQFIHNLEVKETNDKIIINNHHFVCPQFLYSKKTEGFILSTNTRQEIKGRRVFTPHLQIKHSIWGFNDRYVKMLNAPEPTLPYRIINNYSRIELTKTGDLIIEPNKYDMLYSIPIEDSLELIKLWEEKYNDIISDLCRRNVFIPTLTGGCDTRILSHFWRKHNLKYYRLRSVKKDGKNNIEKGKIEIDIAEKVLKKLGKGLTRLEEPPEDYISICGTYTESTQYTELLNNKRFITDVVNRCDFEWYQVQPFIDDLYLQIKPSKLFQIRVLFMLLFCPDLLGIELISDSAQGIYSFKDFGQLITECKEIISKWNYSVPKIYI